MKINFGIEIEGIFDTGKIPLHHQGWRTIHVGEQIEDWSITSDSSLHTKGENFIKAVPLEIVSKTFDSKNFDSVIKNFKTHFRNKSNVDHKRKELSEYMSFNKTCGCHIHFSSEKLIENHLITMNMYKELRNRTFERVRLEVPEVYRDFKNQYFRDYAKEQSGTLIDKKLRGEISYDNLAKGIEWRSFNLCGVTKWKQLTDMLTIAKEEIERFLNTLDENNCEEEYETVITDEDIDYYKDYINIITINRGN